MMSVAREAIIPDMPTSFCMLLISVFPIISTIYVCIEVNHVAAVVCF